MIFHNQHDQANAPRLVLSQKDECGAEAVEVVFVLPLLVLFVVAILHFGLQMVAAESFTGRADAAVMTLAIDEESVKQADGAALMASANASSAFSSDSSMRVTSVSVGGEKQIAAGDNSSGSYIPLVYTVSYRLPALLGKDDAKTIEKSVVRRIPVKSVTTDDASKKPEAGSGDADQGGTSSAPDEGSTDATGQGGTSQGASAGSGSASDVDAAGKGPSNG